MKLLLLYVSLHTIRASIEAGGSRVTTSNDGDQKCSNMIIPQCKAVLLCKCNIFNDNSHSKLQIVPANVPKGLRHVFWLFNSYSVK